jgi:hypothetical protein
MAAGAAHAQACRSGGPSQAIPNVITGGVMASGVRGV